MKPGRDQEFLDAHRQVEQDWTGLRHANIIRTGEGLYCVIAEWDDMESMAAARPFRSAPSGAPRSTAVLLLLLLLVLKLRGTSRPGAFQFGVIPNPGRRRRGRGRRGQFDCGTGSSGLSSAS